MGARELLDHEIEKNRKTNQLIYISTTAKDAQYGFRVGELGGKATFIAAESLEEMQFLFDELLKSKPLAGRFHTIFFNPEYLEKVEMKHAGGNDMFIALIFRSGGTLEYCYFDDPEECGRDYAYFLEQLEEWQGGEANSFFDNSIAH